MSTQESGPAFTSPPFDVSTDRICVNHITLTPPHLAPPVPKARPANTQSVNKYQYRRMSCRWQILPNCVTAPAGIHSPPLSPAHFLRIGGKITSTNTHCAIHLVVMTCGSTLRMPPPIHRSSPQSPSLHIWTHIPFVRYLPNQRYHSSYPVEPRRCCITAEKENPTA